MAPPRANEPRKLEYGGRDVDISVNNDKARRVCLPPHVPHAHGYAHGIYYLLASGRELARRARWKIGSYIIYVAYVA